MSRSRFPELIAPTTLVATVPRSCWETDAVPRLSSELRTFVETRFASFQELETLLLLLRHGDRSWSVESVSDRLKMSESEAAACLKHVVELELAMLEPCANAGSRRFRYAPRTTELARLVDALAHAWDDHVRFERRLVRDARRPLRARPRPPLRPRRFLLH